MLASPAIAGSPPIAAAGLVDRTGDLNVTPDDHSHKTTRREDHPWPKKKVCAPSTPCDDEYTPVSNVTHHKMRPGHTLNIITTPSTRREARSSGLYGGLGGRSRLCQQRGHRRLTELHRPFKPGCPPPAKSVSVDLARLSQIYIEKISESTRGPPARSSTATHSRHWLAETQGLDRPAGHSCSRSTQWATVAAAVALVSNPEECAELHWPAGPARAPHTYSPTLRRWVGLPWDETGDH